MRQIFTSLPYVLPADPPEIASLYRARGTKRTVKKGETLKRGGEDAKLFFLTEGLAAYFIAEELTGRPKVLALLPPGHPLIQADCVTVRQIAEEPFIYPRLHHNSDIDDFFTRHKIEPKIHLQTNDPYSAYAMVNAGLGVSVITACKASTSKAMLS